MKKSLLILMLLPLCALAQSTIAVWNSAAAPTGTNAHANVTPSAMGSTGISISSDTNQNQWEAFGIYLSNLHTSSSSTSLISSRYIEFIVKPNTNYKFVPSQFSFSYLSPSDAGARKLQAQWSTNGTTWTNLSNAAIANQTEINLTQGSQSIVTLNFASGINVLPTQELKVRVYFYDLINNHYSKFFLRTKTYSSVDGPKLTGTVSLAGGVIANNNSASTLQNAPVNIDVLANDISTGTTFGAVTIDTAPSAASGTAVVQANKTITFTPANNYTGNTSFKYKVAGADGSSSTAFVYVTVNPFVAPTAVNDNATTGQNIAITISPLANDTAGSGAITTLEVIAQPANGTATVNGNNIVYTPVSTFTGTNTITYKITDTNGKFATATITVTVEAIIAASAVNDSATTAKNTPVNISVLSNDTVGNSALTAMVITTQPTNGSVVVNGNNTITYTPANNYTGNDSFKYKITNAYGTSSTATVSVQVLHPAPSAALCGTYVISAVQQADYPQFSTITAAVAHLNQHGVTCPVTFILKDAVYNNASGETFPININVIPGSTTTNTVTFKPGAYKNVRIEAFRDAVVGSYTGVPAVFKLNGTDNVIFDGSNVVNGTTRNLTIVNSSFAGGDDHSNDYTDRTVLWLASTGAGSGCENITVKYAAIKQTWKNTSDNFCVGLYAGNDAVTSQNEITTGEATAAHKNINVIGNDFTNVKQGIYINGNEATPAQNIYVYQNDLGAENNTETIILPVALNDVNGFDITENYIYQLIRDNSSGNLMAAGMHVTGKTKNGIIQKNDFKNLSRNVANGQTFAAIVLSSELDDSNITVANNFILNVSALGNSGGYSNGYGIIADTGGSYKIYHNTVSLNTNQPQGGYSAAFYVNSSVTKLDVRNNIFANNQTNTATRRSAIMVNNDVDNIHTIFTNLDYNNYYSTDRIGYIANIHDLGITWIDNPDFVTTLSGWKAALANSSNTTSTGNRDLHSVNHNTVFASATDLHLIEGNDAIDNEGTPIAAVTKDIDGQLRSTTKPTIGADEYGEPEMPTGETNQGIYCATSTRYQNGVWSNGEPTAEKDVIFASDYTQTGGTLYACSIYVIGTAKVNFISHSNAIVTHAVSVAATGSLTFESGSALRQIENTANTGNVVIKRNSSLLKRLDYTLWSSPVKKQKLLAFSPATTTDRFYTYNTATDQYNAVAAATVATTNFTAAKGYLIRMPNGYATPGYNDGTTAIIYPGKFTGTPNNGTVRIPLVYGKYTNGIADNNGTLKQYNAVGNPYASPINITDFLTENADVIDGTIYFWRKTNDYTKSSYWTCNQSGAVANAAPGGINDLVNYPHAIDPTGLINTGQGFIVKALGANKEVVFKNNMRRSETYDNFFRMPSSANQVNNVPGQTGIPNASRVWLNVENSAGTFAQTMVAYTDIATTEYDNGFDGTALLDGGVSLYSIIPDYKLAIQSLPAFTDNSVVKLGFKTTVEGTFEVKIYEKDGLFADGQAVYLKDKQNNIMHNLQDGNYTFTSETGTFEDRFEIHYTTDSALGNDTPQIAAKDVMIYANDKQIKVKSTETIAAVKVYDIQGKLVYEKSNIGAAEFSTATLTTAQQVLVVNVTFEGGQAVSKKIMMN